LFNKVPGTKFHGIVETNIDITEWGLKLTRWIGDSQPAKKNGRCIGRRNEK
jgi:hypothetical protein